MDLEVSSMDRLGVWGLINDSGCATLARDARSAAHVHRWLSNRWPTDAAATANQNQLQ